MMRVFVSTEYCNSCVTVGADEDSTVGSLCETCLVRLPPTDQASPAVPSLALVTEIGNTRNTRRLSDLCQSDLIGDVLREGDSLVLKWSIVDVVDAPIENHELPSQGEGQHELNVRVLDVAQLSLGHSPWRRLDVRIVQDATLEDLIKHLNTAMGTTVHWELGTEAMMLHRDSEKDSATPAAELFPSGEVPSPSTLSPHQLHTIAQAASCMMNRMP